MGCYKIEFFVVLIIDNAMHEREREKNVFNGLEECSFVKASSVQASFQANFEHWFGMGYFLLCEHGP